VSKTWPGWRPQVVADEVTPWGWRAFAALSGGVTWCGGGGEPDEETEDR
jgi:hypothetical protein